MQDLEPNRGGATRHVGDGRQVVRAGDDAAVVDDPTATGPSTESTARRRSSRTGSTVTSTWFAIRL